MNLQALINRLDHFQQSHHLSAIIFAVIRKYGDDHGAYLGALITYYGFLSLFPLLLAITSILKIALAYHLPLAANMSSAVANIFPLIGQDLNRNVHSLTGTGLTLALGILLSLYGARGVADAIRYALNEIWQVPKTDRLSFPADLIQSFQTIGIGGTGFLTSSVIGGLIPSVGHNLPLSILGHLVSLAVIYGTLLAVFILATPKNVRRADVKKGALVMAIAIQLLQSFGTILLARQLNHLSAAYGTFALVLGLIFYISLQAQIMIYALEYNMVMRRKLWPRSLS